MHVGRGAAERRYSALASALVGMGSSGRARAERSRSFASAERFAHVVSGLETEGEPRELVAVGVRAGAPEFSEQRLSRCGVSVARSFRSVALGAEVVDHGDDFA